MKWYNKTVANVRIMKLGESDEREEIQSGISLKIFIALLEVGLFGLVLWNDYGPMVFEQDRWLGYLFTMVLYVIVYISLGKLFRAFKIADYSISEDHLFSGLSVWAD